MMARGIACKGESSALDRLRHAVESFDRGPAFGKVVEANGGITAPVLDLKNCDLA